MPSPARCRPVLVSALTLVAAPGMAREDAISLLPFPCRYKRKRPRLQSESWGEIGRTALPRTAQRQPNAVHVPCQKTAKQVLSQLAHLMRDAGSTTVAQAARFSSRPNSTTGGGSQPPRD